MNATEFTTVFSASVAERIRRRLMRSRKLWIVIEQVEGAFRLSVCYCDGTAVSQAMIVLLRSEAQILAR